MCIPKEFTWNSLPLPFQNMAIENMSKLLHCTYTDLSFRFGPCCMMSIIPPALRVSLLSWCSKHHSWPPSPADLAPQNSRLPANSSTIHGPPPINLVSSIHALVFLSDAQDQQNQPPPLCLWPTRVNQREAKGHCSCIIPLPTDLLAYCCLEQSTEFCFCGGTVCVVSHNSYNTNILHSEPVLPVKKTNGLLVSCTITWYTLVSH